MYTVSLTQGTVTRADGVVVAPCQSVEEPDFVAYIAWINAGGVPLVVD
jgi:hypothetical protein